MGNYKGKPKDPRGKFTMIFHSVMKSPAFHALSWSARAIYIEVRLSLGETNNGDISATLAGFKSRGDTISSATLSKALNDLQTVGLIDQTRQGGIAANGKNCSLYRFTDQAVHQMPAKGIEAFKATHDYKEFKTIEEARAALQNSKGGAAAKKESQRSQERRAENKKSKVQTLNLHGSKSEPTSGFVGLESKRGGGLSVQIMNLQNIDLPPLNLNEYAAFEHFGCTLQ